MSAPESRPAVDVAAPITDSGPMLEENKIYDPGNGDAPGGEGMASAQSVMGNHSAEQDEYESMTCEDSTSGETIRKPIPQSSNVSGVTPSNDVFVAPRPVLRPATSWVEPHPNLGASGPYADPLDELESDSPIGFPDTSEGDTKLGVRATSYDATGSGPPPRYVRLSDTDSTDSASVLPRKGWTRSMNRPRGKKKRCRTRRKRRKNRKPKSIRSKQQEPFPYSSDAGASSASVSSSPPAKHHKAGSDGGGGGSADDMNDTTTLEPLPILTLL